MSKADEALWAWRLRDYTQNSLRQLFHDTMDSEHVLHRAWHRLARSELARRSLARGGA